MLTTPLITMRLVAEERKLRASEIEIVLAKLIASMILLAAHATLVPLVSVCSAIPTCGRSALAVGAFPT
jgi:hypothetical protein